MKLRELRLAKNWSQRELSNYSGISLRAISYLENHHRKLPHYDTQRRLLHALHIPWERHRDVFPGGAE